MKAKKIMGAVRVYVDETIRSYMDPSERKVEQARRKVHAAKQELREALHEVKRAGEEWKKFREEIRVKIEENEAKILQLRKKMTDAAGDTLKAGYEEKLAEMEMKNNQLKRRIGQFRSEGMEKWNEFRRAFVHSMSELGHAVKQLVRTEPSPAQPQMKD